MLHTPFECNRNLQKNRKIVTVTSADGWCMQMQEGDESYPLYKKERDGLLSSLKRRAEMIEEVRSTTAELVPCTMVSWNKTNKNWSVSLTCCITHQRRLRYMPNK